MAQIVRPTVCMSCLQPYQCQTRLVVVHLAQVSRAFGDDEFERRADVARPEMTCQRGTVALPHDQMKMDRWLAIRRQRNIADQRCDLDLLIDAVLQILPVSPVEIFEDHLLERADAGDLSCLEPRLLGKPAQAFHGLVAGLQYDGKRALAAAFMKKLVLHVLPPLSVLDAR